MGRVSPYGHRAQPLREPPNVRTYCAVCLRPITYVRRTDRNGWWAHPRRRRARRT